MTFKTIETQEDFDKAISERINRERETLNKKYSDYDQLKKQNESLTSEVTSLKSTIKDSTEKYSDYDKNIESLNSKISEYETSNLRTKIALSKGIPYDLANRLTGSTEEELNNDADKLASFVKSNEPTPPLKSTEPNELNDENQSYVSLINNLTNKGE